MKKIIYLFLIVSSLSSCKKWLDVTPKSQVASTELFKTEQGFKDALIGSYLLMTKSSTYGFESTCGFMDVLAQQYTITASSHPYYNTSLYQYGVLQSKIDPMWSSDYTVIANLNNIIENIDKQNNIVVPANYAMIKGECLGLRAFLHFDLYRMFSYGNLVKTPSLLQNMSRVPYVTSYTKNITPSITVTAYIDSLKHDLATAAALLCPYDSSGVGKNSNILPNDDQFYSERKLRFNYLAVKATQARLFMWLGEYQNAIDAAGEVVRRAPNLNITWHNGNITSGTLTLKDYTFSTEHIFGLNVLNLWDITKSNFSQTGADGISANAACLKQSVAGFNTLYEYPTKQYSLTDWRYAYLYTKTSTDCFLLKFNYADGSNYKDKMPLIKLPEMFYIEAEAYNEINRSDSAIKALNYVRKMRNINTANPNNNIPATLTKDQVTTEITREWRKEFVGEGQLFYYYKRRGETSIVGTGRSMDTTVYNLPVPLGELQYVNR